MADPFTRARATLGTPFRLHGRDAAIGLDCVGVALLAYELSSETAPLYRLRDGGWSQIDGYLRQLFRRVNRPQGRTGDLLVVREGSGFHFAVRGPRSMIQAHLRLGRVVETPGLPEHDTYRVYRRRTRGKR